MNKIFFGGTDEKYYFDLACSFGVKRVLMSYWKLKDRPGVLEERKNSYPEVDILVDSGAFSLREKGKKFEAGDFVAYLNEYVDWLEDNKQYLFGAVELDVDEYIDVETVFDWHDSHFQKLDLPIIYVWHPERGKDGWEYMCRSYPYVGVPRDLPRDTVAALIRNARACLCKTHGFGVTGQWALSNSLFFSVDSTTWKTTERWGCLYYWDGSSVKCLSRHRKNDWKQVRELLEARGLDWNKIEAEENEELTKSALLAYTQLQDSLDTDFLLHWEYRLPTRFLSDEEIKEWAKRFRIWGAPSFQYLREVVECIQAVQNNRNTKHNAKEKIGWLLKEEIKDAWGKDTLVKLNTRLLPTTKHYKHVFQKQSETPSIEEVSWEDL